MWGDISIAFLLAFVTAFVVTPYTIRLSKRLGAIDKPEKRRINLSPMPRLGGIAVIIGFLLSCTYLLIIMTLEKTFFPFGEEQYFRKLIGILLGILVLGIFGFADDVKGLPAIVKLIGQTIAAIIVVSFGIQIDNVNITYKQPCLYIYFISRMDSRNHKCNKFNRWIRWFVIRNHIDFMFFTNYSIYNESITNYSNNTNNSFSWCNSWIFTI